MRYGKRQREQPQTVRRSVAPVTPSVPQPYLRLLLVNIIIAFIWQQRFPFFGLADYLIGLGIGFFMGWFVNRAYALWMYDLGYFSAYVLWAIVISNLRLAKLVLQPKPPLNPGIIGIPLTALSTLEILILASAITLTPGTISVDVSKDAPGKQVLYVHNLTIGDPEDFRMSIKNTIERLLLRVTRGREVLVSGRS